MNRDGWGCFAIVLAVAVGALADLLVPGTLIWWAKILLVAAVVGFVSLAQSRPGRKGSGSDE